MLSMGRISKKFSLLFVLILAVSSIIMAKPAFAQTIPTPSVPTFTIQYFFNAIAPTYTINP
jgi:uncharacterized protein (UPF0333 family)